ncbi:MAG: thioesterase family protein [Rikenellaceae bacterium]
MIKTDIQIRFSDIDMLGHVNNVILQQYFDQGKQLYFREVMGLSTLWSGNSFTTAATNTSYFVETRINDKIYVTTQIERLGTKSITFFQRIIEKESEIIKSESRSVLVGFDLKERKSIVISDLLRSKIENHENFNQI